MNKYGYRTQNFANFDLALACLMNEKYFEENIDYFSDEIVSKEVEDQQNGLAGDQSMQDLRYLIHDKHDDHHERFKCLQWPDRVGSNYEKGDQLSCYKILPKKN